jgi:hypothetical protein
MITTENETLAIPLDHATEARVHLEFGGGELRIEQAPSGLVLAGVAPGAIVEATGTARLHLRPAAPTIHWRPVTWRLGLTAEVPLELHLETGANRSTIDLVALRVRRLQLDTGASETRIRLPATGPAEVRVACGFALVTLEVPMDVPVRIHGRLVLGATDIDERRFPRSADGWASPDATVADDGIDIHLEGAFGTVRVV